MQLRMIAQHFARDGAPFFHPQLADIKHDHRSEDGKTIRPTLRSLVIRLSDAERDCAADAIADGLIRGAGGQGKRMPRGDPRGPIAPRQDLTDRAGTGGRAIAAGIRYGPRAAC